MINRKPVGITGEVWCEWGEPFWRWKVHVDQRSNACGMSSGTAPSEREAWNRASDAFYRMTYFGQPVPDGK